jgi:hypothetical protein
MRHLAIAVSILLLFAPGAALGGEAKAKPACPSLDGEWSGDFDGTFEGVWHATFNQSGENVRATAEITLDSGPRIEAEGSGGIKCEDGKTGIAGSGSAKEKSGSFSGLSDETGNKLSGTWWSGDYAGTWRGERTIEEP